MYIQEKNTTEDVAVWARPFAFHSYGELTKKKKKLSSQYYLVRTPARCDAIFVVFYGLQLPPTKSKSIMADSTVADVAKLKVVDLRRELKSRGLSYVGDKAELVARLQAAMAQDDHGDINLDSDEIDSDGVLEDEDDKNQTDILDEAGVDTLNEELALADNPSPIKDTSNTKPPRVLKRKITMSDIDKDKSAATKTADGKDLGGKKIVLNRAISLTSTTPKPVAESVDEKPTEDIKPAESNKVKITAEIDPKTRLEMRAKRFGLPVKMSDAERKEARKQRFGQNAGSTSSPLPSMTGSLSENLDKLKKRSERFGQSVSKIISDIENKEKLERRKAKFGTAK
jgi:SAP domain-containing ribonucleoprotein